MLQQLQEGKDRLSRSSMITCRFIQQYQVRKEKKSYAKLVGRLQRVESLLSAQAQPAKCKGEAIEATVPSLMSSSVWFHVAYHLSRRKHRVALKQIQGKQQHHVLDTTNVMLCL